MEPTASEKPVEIAVFDFDGTSIEGNSPVILVRHLHREGLLKKRVLTRILLWAMAYKLRLPQDESWVRGAVFSSFEGKPQSEVDAYLERFYDEHIDRLFRKSADEEIARHRACGREVWAVTATFEPIIRRCVQTHGFTRQYSTRMRTDENGCYTCAVDGWPVEGIEKYNIVRRKADELYGPGNWVVTHAYGDHHSDVPVLTLAEEPCAVTPDRPLRRRAKNEGWRIVKW